MAPIPLPQPTPEQVEAYRAAWRLAWSREPGRTAHRASTRHAVVANYMARHGVPIVGREWPRVRGDWREVLNRLAFEAQS